MPGLLPFAVLVCVLVWCPCGHLMRLLVPSAPGPCATWPPSALPCPCMRYLPQALPNRGAAAALRPTGLHCIGRWGGMPGPCKDGPTLPLPVCPLHCGHQPSTAPPVLCCTLRSACPGLLFRGCCHPPGPSLASPIRYGDSLHPIHHHGWCIMCYHLSFVMFGFVGMVWVICVSCRPFQWYAVGCWWRRLPASPCCVMLLALMPALPSVLTHYAHPSN